MAPSNIYGETTHSAHPLRDRFPHQVQLRLTSSGVDACRRTIADAAVRVGTSGWTTWTEDLAGQSCLIVGFREPEAASRFRSLIDPFRIGL